MNNLIVSNVRKLFILSDDLQLCLLKDTDELINDLYDIYREPTVFKYYSNKPSIRNKRMLSIYVKNQINECNRGYIIVWNIKYLNKVIGQVQLFNFDNCRTCAQISYFLHPKFWNRGINTVVVCAISEYGIINLGLQRIEAYVYHKNVASCKSLEKAGYEMEGLLRNKYQINGSIDDCYIYSKVQKT